MSKLTCDICGGSVSENPPDTVAPASKPEPSTATRPAVPHTSARQPTIHDDGATRPYTSPQTVPDMDIRDGVLVKYTGTASELVVPDGVTVIGDEAFADCKTLQRIVLPDSLTSIGYCAFFGCDALQSVRLPARLVRIRDYAFAFCTALTAIAIPEWTTDLGMGCFANCTQLASVRVTEEQVTPEAFVGTPWYETR